jgi:hypothetical protein
MERKCSDERELNEERKRGEERENVILYVLDLTYSVRKHMQGNAALAPHAEPSQ